MMEYPNYYAIIPAEVRYSPNLTASQKLFYGEISCLTLKTGECWATNNYFAELYGVDENTVSRWVKALAKEGFIDVEYNESTRIIRLKTLYTDVEPLYKNVEDPLHLCRYPSTKMSNRRIQNKKSNIKNKYYYGDYGNVLLTDDERTKLDEQYGPELVKKAIDWFDAYIEEKGYKCKSHYLAMKRWVFSAVKEQESRRPSETVEKYEMNLGEDDGLKYL